MSPKFASTTPSDADKTREQLLAELGELRSKNAVLKESRAKSKNIQNRSGNHAEEEFRRANRALKALSECKEAMIRAGDEAVLLNDICQIIVDVGGYRMAWIGYIENDEVKTVRPVARAGYDEGYVDYLKIALEDPVRGNGPTGISLKTGKQYGSKNVLLDEEMLPWRAEALKRGYHSTLNLPIVYEKQVIGSLVIYSGEVGVFDDEERGLLFGLAQTLAYGITAMRDRARRIRAEGELKRANEELEIRIDERTAKLRESEERFRQLADNSPIPMAINDKDDNITYLNKKFIEIFGYTLKDIPHLKYWWSLAYPDPVYREDAIKRWEKGVEETVRESKEIGPIDFTVRCKDGSVRYAEISGVPIGDKELVILQDVTDRKRAVEALRKSEASLAKSQEMAHIGSWEMDVETGDINRSTESYRIFGFPPGDVNLNYHMFLECIVPDDRERVDNVIKLTMKTGQPYNIIYNIKRRGGESRSLQSHGEAIKDASGRTIKIFGTNQDITERKRADEALRESEERFRALADNIPNLAWMADADGWIFWYNKQWYDYTGTTLEEMQGWGWQKVHHQDHVESVTKEWSTSIKEGKPFDNIFPLRGKDGNYRWFLTRVTPIRDKQGNIQRWFGTNTDITDRKRAEEELMVSEASLAMSQAIAHLGSWEVDVRTNMVWGSDELYRMFNLEHGFTLDAYVEKMHPEDRPSVVESINAAINGGKLYSIDYRIVPRPDEVRYVHAEGKVTRDENGLPVKFFGTIQDITERKQLEEALYDAKAQAELYLDLMGHDINNMNQVGLGNLEIALEKLKEEGRIEVKDSELLEKPLRVIQDSSRLIDNVRKLRSAKSKEYQLQPIDLREVLESVKAQFSKVNGRHITINYTPIESHVLATGLVKDVFVNIVGNAIKHSDANKPLEINITQTHVYDTDESYHKIIIEDNGPGIPDESKNRIFNRFERGNTKAIGKGLGLYLVKTLVHDFDGNIWVEDCVQGDHTKGAKFVVMLPAVEK